MSSAPRRLRRAPPLSMISVTMVPMTKTILSAIKNALARVAFRIEDRKADRKYEREGKNGFNGDFAVVAFRPDGFRTDRSTRIYSCISKHE